MDDSAKTCDETAKTNDAETPPSSGPTWEAAELLQGRKEAVIRLGEVTYRLRLTATGKLLLTK